MVSDHLIGSDWELMGVVGGNRMYIANWWDMVWKETFRRPRVSATVLGMSCIANV